VVVSSSNISHLIIQVTGTLALGKGAVIRVRNGCHPNAPADSIATLGSDSLETLGVLADGVRVYPNLYGRGGNGGPGGDSYVASKSGYKYKPGAGGGGGGGFGGGYAGSGGILDGGGSMYNGQSGSGQAGGKGGNAEVYGGQDLWAWATGGAGGAGGSGTTLGEAGGNGMVDDQTFLLGGGGGGGGGNGGNGGSSARSFSGESGGGGGGGGYGGGVLTIIANTIRYDDAEPPRFLVSGQKGGSPGGQDGEGGLLIIESPNYAASSNHWSLGASTYGTHNPAIANGGHGIVTGNPQNVFTNSIPPEVLLSIIPGSVAWTRGQLQFTVQGETGRVFEVQASANLGLANWTTLATLTNLTGTLLFNDTATNLPLRFYRLRQLP
jgi:hypothetical protein